MNTHERTATAETTPLGPDQRRQIAGRARTLQERLGGPANDPGDPERDPAEATLTAWRDQFPDESAWRDRLARDGLSEADCRDAAGATMWPAAEPLPAWIDTLDDVLGIALALDADERTRLAERYGDPPDTDKQRPEGAGTADSDIETPAATDRLPFSRIVSAFVAAGLDGLPQSATEVLSETARDTLAGWLHDRLVKISTRVLFVEFRSFLEIVAEDRADATAEDFDTAPTENYDEFRRRLFDGGLVDLVVEYPTFARLVVQQLRQWTGLVTDLCERVRADADALGAEFGLDASLPLADADPLATDTHRDGRAPVEVVFDSGESVVYKPRPVAAADLFTTALDRFTEASDTARSFDTPSYLDRADYGWMSWVPYRDPADEAAVERYYERVGTLLCLCYVLGVSDVQLENLVVNGDQPVIVDAETAFGPRLDPADAELPATTVELLRESVLDSSLLPRTLVPEERADPETDGRAAAGLGAASDPTDLSAVESTVVAHANTDLMDVETEPVLSARHRNTPTVEGTDHPPHEYTETITDAFERAYETVADLRADETFFHRIVAPEEIAGIESRVLYRGTRRYTGVVWSALRHEAMRDGARFSAAVERLAVPFFDGRIETERSWPLYDAERTAVERLDPPRLTCPTDGTALRFDGEATGAEAVQSGIEAIRRRLDGLSPSDRRRQRWLIEASLNPTDFDARAVGEGGGSGNSATRSTDRTESLPDDRAESLAADALDAVIAGDDVTESESHCWPLVKENREPSQLLLSRTGDGLYHGRGGIAVAAAAAFRVTGRDRYRDLARGALDAVDPTAARSLGGLPGSGGVVYAFAVAGELLDDEELRADAVAAAERVTAEQLATDETFDVVGGTAGTLLGLLACWDRTGDRAVLERAVTCGERLLDARETVAVSGESFAVWETTESEPITGFAHGTSGIAHALARLADRLDATDGDTTDATPDRFRDAAREAFRFGAARYDDGRENWQTTPDLGFADRWCYGRTGILLARLSATEWLDGVEIPVSDHTAVARRITESGVAPVDHLCCGTTGRADVLREATEWGVGPSDSARDLLASCLAHRSEEAQTASAVESFSLPGHGSPVVDPTLFDGLSGVAYALLRVAEPSLPCVVRLE